MITNCKIALTHSITDTHIFIPQFFHPAVLIPDVSGFDGNTTSSIEPSGAPGTTFPPGNFPTSTEEGGPSAAYLASVSGVTALIMPTLAALYIFFV